MLMLKCLKVNVEIPEIPELLHTYFEIKSIILISEHQKGENTMEKLIEKYKNLSDAELGALVKMMSDYKNTGKAETNNKQVKILFYAYVKKELDLILKERNRKRGNNNGK